jgi:hypothetical protein
MPYSDYQETRGGRCRLETSETPFLKPHMLGLRTGKVFGKVSEKSSGKISGTIVG